MANKSAPARTSAAVQARAALAAQRQQAARDMLAALDAVANLPPAEIDRLLMLGVFRAFSPATTIFGRQKHDRFLFFVLRGHLQLHLRDKDGHEMLMALLGPGDCCGEGPLFGDLFRRMSATAVTGCYLFQVPLADLQEQLPDLPELYVALNRIHQRRMLESTLTRIPLLSSLVPVERFALANILRHSSFSRGSLIIRQGDHANSLYLIERGQVSIEQDGRTLATLADGDFFGEIALLSGHPHRATVRAITPTDLLALPAADFHALLQDHPNLEASLRIVVEQRNQRNAALHADQSRARDLTQAVARGLLRGSHLLARTPSLCPPGCQICEEACVGRHGHQRLNLNGTLIDGFDILDACRQCTVGPECVEACPEHAFERTEEGVLLITQRCTGCGACIPACPYQVVSSITQEHFEPEALSLWKRLLRRFQPQPSAPLSAPQRADKCDLCYGHPDQACVSACPTGALRLASVEEIFPL
ncbi:cyclic nucleotide-binding protein [Oscillochloris trichoides DG-6]|uniref:Cyclic nucleotide-binding protein n=1 Tax=Oscillochloris trichoides DG-6 TaxID=765420 RepID=E1IHA3_9CHLR|nr:cyclic nucleotide-binding domain-containing protein [Oscillochloris trichoides]EFO79578.1 cyclic nucleotide-binding protein [Oscillochloris trichoides DG-6]